MAGNNTGRVTILTVIGLCASAEHAEAADTTGDAAALTEIRVWGSQAAESRASNSNPVSVLSPADTASINIATTEDVVKYEPSLVVRRRFVGDANGTLGLRGANMFQTSRSMVIADGVPLHYLLESRWSGAPRWNLVSASEIARTEVIYGPFSAEYSGNAMGGVVVMETAIPQAREIHIDGALFRQPFDAYGFDDNIDGYRGFASYGDRFGDLSLYLSYNHLDNQSQPQSFYYGGTASDAGTPGQGAISGADQYGNSQLYFGDSGVIDTATDNYKVKLGYTFGHWDTLLNVALEERASRQNAVNSYVRDADGNLLWGGTVSQDGSTFAIPASRLAVSDHERRSLSMGWRLRGELTPTTTLETNLSHFEILRDNTRTSATNPHHPAYSTAGQVQDYGDTGWHTAQVKFDTRLASGNLNLTTGLHYEAYELNRNVYNSDNYLGGAKSDLSSASGGETTMAAGFAQLHWLPGERWQVTVGGRYEHWRSDDGYYTEADGNALERQLVPGRSESRLSPKFSGTFMPGDDWTLQYSAARAFRFPIVEELFSQYQAYNAVSEANPDLAPEAGLHHNLMLERGLDNGYVRVNLFQETVDDVIDAQATVVPGGRSIYTFVPVDEVRTRGAEFIVNGRGLVWRPLDIRFNLVWTDAEITANSADPAIVGNRYPRMPEWRGNLLATWHLGSQIDVGASLQYAGDSYGRLDNADSEANVYGAQDSYTRLGLKASYQYNSHVGVNIGVDNLTDDIAYVAHPWPGRTFYLGFSLDY